MDWIPRTCIEGVSPVACSMWAFHLIIISCTPDSVCCAELVGQCTDWWTLGPLDPDDVNAVSSVNLPRVLKSPTIGTLLHNPINFHLLKPTESI